MCGLKDRYDFAFSLGLSCTCSEALRRCGMQFHSFPFDWASTGHIVPHAQFVADGFKDFLKLENLVDRGANEEQNGRFCEDRVTHMHYVHDFSATKSLADAFDEVKAKYDRRCAKLLERLSQAKSVLAVCTQIPSKPTAPDAELVEAQQVMAQRYPESEMDVLYVYSVPDRPLAEIRLETVAPHVFKIGADIRMPPGSNPFISNRKVIIPILKMLVPKAVPDYRSPDERKAYVRVEREKRYRAMHATTRWEYLVNRFNWLMFRHFRNRLEKLGFENLPSHRAQ